MNGFRTAVERRDGRRDGQQARQARSGKGKPGKGRTKWGNKPGQERTNAIVEKGKKINKEICTSRARI